MHKFIFVLLALPALLFGQDSLNVRRVAQLNYGSETAAVTVAGDLAFVCNTGSGLHVMDVSNPSLPVEIGFCRVPRELFDVVLSGNYAVVAGDFSTVHGNEVIVGSAIYVIDISNPLVPMIVGWRVIDSYAYRITVIGNVVYCAGEFGIYAIDISVPSSPVVAYYSVDDGIIDYQTALVADSGYVYFFGDLSGFRVMDFSTPSEPVEIARLAFDYTFNQLSKSGNLIYVSTNIVIDVSDPLNPELLLVPDFCMNPVEDFVVIDGIAYCAEWNGTLRIMDVSNLLDPEQIGSVQVADEMQRLFVANGQVYSAHRDNGIHIVDVSNLATPEETGQFDFHGYLRGLTFYGNYVLAGNDLSGLRIIDVTNPASPVDFGSRDTPGRAFGAAVFDHFVYVADDSSGILILDVSDPTDPVPVDTIDTHGNATKIFATEDNYAFVANGSAGLLILDASIPGIPSYVSEYPTDASMQDVVVRDTLAFLVDLIGLKILNTSNPTAPELIGEFETGGQAYAVQVEGNIAYVADAQDGLRIIDVSNLSSPVELGSIDTPGSAVGLLVSDNHAFIGDQSCGLRVIDISNPVMPIEVGYYDTPGSTWGIVKRDNYIFLADSAYFSIYDVSAALSTPEHQNEIATEFSLHPIYPNPFNNTANIAFDLPREVTGRLVVYDVLGRMTITLFDGKLAAGSHSMQFYGNGLSSGTYFVRLETPTSSATQKAILLK